MGYRIETRTFEELQGKLKLPTFQRALVWSNNQKQEFFNTLKDGFPFGSILLYEYENENKYSLIDGLQRYTTMLDFKDNPTNYIELEEFAQNVADLYKNASDSTRAEIINYAKDELLNIIETHIDTNSDNPKVNELAKNMVDKFPVLADTDTRDEITQIQSDVITYFNNQLDISNVKIPCIFFEGEETELAEVFQKLNSGGKKLSKYQVFAAHWDRYDIELGDKTYSNQILTNVIERYEKLNSDRGILIENFDPKEMENSRTINLSELCYGLGKIISDELYAFFNNPTEDICNELGFQTMLIAFSLPTNKMNELPHKYRYLKNKNNIEELFTNIVKIYKIINNKFKESFSMVVSSRENKYETKSFTRLQIMSFFSSLWTESYKLELNENKNSFSINPMKSLKKNQKQILSNIIVYAIYDVIRKYWSGTGDRKLMDIYISHNNRYLKTLPKDVFRNELLRWNEENVNKPSINIQTDEKMIVTFIANKYRSFYSSLNDNLDYEHIFSRKLYNKHKNNFFIPAGSLGNIMLLDAGINRRKKEKFLYSAIDIDKISVDGSLENKYIRFSNYPEKRVIDTIEMDLLNDQYENLIQMIKKRGDKLIEEVVDILY
ncbi:DUF262 domain-containing protein [Mammaliicoccus sciuri]|uniref:DUF262 domain-containing protein n=1 Tax=Mammaliicoccus sciuri TaxID=1296 RepID=UPI002B25675E|nr:DUF262 domain-containing protein [Mammaliicoccus sciuri]WQJ65422.1 DUF262 domain-containing protein [Mammaliicoccus sciuri]